MRAHTRNHPYLLKGRAGLPVCGQMSIWGTQATWPPLLCARIIDQHEVLSSGPVASVRVTTLPWNQHMSRLEAPPPPPKNSSGAATPFQMKKQSPREK